MAKKSTATIKEWREHLAEKAKTPDLSHLRMLRQAAIHAKFLTSDPNWDQFLSFVQGAIETAGENLEASKDKLADPMIVDQGEILRLKARISNLDGMIKALEWVVEVPKGLVETGKLIRGLDIEAPES